MATEAAASYCMSFDPYSQQLTGSMGFQEVKNGAAAATADTQCFKVLNVNLLVRDLNCLTILSDYLQDSFSLQFSFIRARLKINRISFVLSILEMSY